MPQAAADHSPKAEDLDAEEIAGAKRVPVRLDELLLWPPLLPLRRQLHAVRAARISATVARPISIASPVRSASLILVYPQLGLAVAISMTSLRTSLGLAGRLRLASELPYVLATS